MSWNIASILTFLAHKIDAWHFRQSHIGPKNYLPRHVSHTHVHTRKHTLTHARTCTYTHTQTRTHTLKHTHTHTNTHRRHPLSPWPHRGRSRPQLPKNAAGPVQPRQPGLQHWQHPHCLPCLLHATTPSSAAAWGSEGRRGWGAGGNSAVDAFRVNLLGHCNMIVCYCFGLVWTVESVCCLFSKCCAWSVAWDPWRWRGEEKRVVPCLLHVIPTHHHNHMPSYHHVANDTGCTLYTVHCTLYPANYTLHTANCTLNTVYCTPYIAHCKLQIARWTLFTAHYALHTYIVPFTLHTVHCKPHIAHRTLQTAHCKLHIAHRKLHTVCCTLHCTLHTVQVAHHKNST